MKSTLPIVNQCVTIALLVNLWHMASPVEAQPVDEARQHYTLLDGVLPSNRIANLGSIDAPAGSTLVDISGDGIAEIVSFDPTLLQLHIQDSRTGAYSSGLPTGLLARIPQNIIARHLFQPPYSRTYRPGTNNVIAFAELNGVPGAEIVLAIRGHAERVVAPNTTEQLFPLALFVLSQGGVVIASVFDPTFEPDQLGVAIAMINNSPYIVVSGLNRGPASAPVSRPEIRIYRPSGQLYQAIPLFQQDNYRAITGRAVGDLNNDGIDEIVVSYDSRAEIHAYSANSPQLLAGFPISHYFPASGVPWGINPPADSNITLVDVDADGYRDIVAVMARVSSNSPSRLAVYNRRALMLAGFPANLSSAGSTTIVAGDVDGDRIAEVIVGQNNCNRSTIPYSQTLTITAIADRGRVPTGWPVTTSQVETCNVNPEYQLLAADLAGIGRAFIGAFTPQTRTVNFYNYSDCRMNIWDGRGVRILNLLFQGVRDIDSGCSVSQTMDAFNDGDQNLSLIIGRTGSLSSGTVIHAIETNIIDLQTRGPATEYTWWASNRDLRRTRALPPSAQVPSSQATPIPTVSMFPTPIPTPTRRS